MKTAALFDALLTQVLSVKPTKDNTGVFLFHYRMHLVQRSHTRRMVVVSLAWAHIQQASNMVSSNASSLPAMEIQQTYTSSKLQRNWWETASSLPIHFMNFTWLTGHQPARRLQNIASYYRVCRAMGAMKGEHIMQMHVYFAANRTSLIWLMFSHV